MENPRKSILPKTRPSTLPHTRLTLDHKQFGDKAFQLQCQREIISFFQENCPEIQITIKHLQTPNTKDYILIFTTLMRLIDPLFELTGRMEDEIPTIFKSLGYPYTISKNSLLAVGAPNSWPTLLAALSWLVDALKCGFDIKRSVSRDVEDQLQVAFRAYELFLTTTVYDDELLEMVEKLKKKHEENLETFEEYSMSIKCLQEEKERLSKQKHLFDNSEQMMNKVRSHIFHLRSVMSNDVASLKQSEEAKIEKLEKLAALQRQLDEIKVENMKLSSRIQGQEYTVEEITKVSQEIASIEQSFSNLESTLKLMKETNGKNSGLLKSLTSETLEKFEKICDASVNIPSLNDKLRNFLQPRTKPEMILDERFVEQEFYTTFKEAGVSAQRYLNDEIVRMQKEISEIVALNQAKSMESANLAIKLEEQKRTLQELKRYDLNEHSGLGPYIEGLSKELRSVEEGLSANRAEIEKGRIMIKEIEARIEGCMREIADVEAKAEMEEKELEAEVQEAYGYAHRMIERVEVMKRNVLEFVNDQARQIADLHRQYMETQGK